MHDTYYWYIFSSKHINRVWDCITAATIVTEILFDATRNLEEDYPLPAHYSQYYEPMEDIRKSKYFNEPVSTYTHKHIRVIATFHFFSQIICYFNILKVFDFCYRTFITFISTYSLNICCVWLLPSVSNHH